MTARKRQQQGIAIGPILFVVAILAVLVAALASGSGGFTASNTTEQDRTTAAAVMVIGNDVRLGLQRVLGNGCDFSQISFANPLSRQDMTNANAPADFSCHVYRPEGGGVIPKVSPAGTGLEQVGYWTITRAIYSEMLVTAGFVGTGIGTAANDLVYVTPITRQSLCMEINNQLGNPNPSGAPPILSHTHSHAPFTGSFAYGFPTALPNPSRMDRGCFDYTSREAGLHLYYQILLAR